MQQITQKLNAKLDDVSIVANDRIQLKAWSIHPRNGNGNAVLLLHGLGDNRAGMTGYAELFLRHGYDVLMPDARAHGESEGTAETYGFLERNDIRSWFEWLTFTQHPHCIYGLGESMGAAQLLQALQTEPDFCAAIAESSFSTFREISYDRVGQFFGAGPWLGRTVLRPVLELAFLYARRKYKINFAEVSPQAAVAATQIPVFLIHGLIDGNIPERHSRRILAANKNVVLWEVPNADHCGAIHTAPQEFESKVISWTENYSSHQETFSSVSNQSLNQHNQY
ncbi:MAG TPA: alpha/beta fold hydrolase [Terriglobales bacterium]